MMPESLVTINGIRSKTFGARHAIVTSESILHLLCERLLWSGLERFLERPLLARIAVIQLTNLNTGCRSKLAGGGHSNGPDEKLKVKTWQQAVLHFGLAYARNGPKPTS